MGSWEIVKKNMEMIWRVPNAPGIVVRVHRKPDFQYITFLTWIAKMITKVSKKGGPM